MIRIGIVGHKVLQEQEAGFVKQQSLEILQQLKDVHKEILTLSATAEGADTIFTAAGMDLHIHYEVVIPFAEYEYDFEGETPNQNFMALKIFADKKTMLPFTHRSEDAYAAGMEWVLDHADSVVAVWNGEPNRGRGGTSDAIEHILRRGLDWIHIDISNYKTHVHVKKNIFRVAKAAG